MGQFVAMGALLGYARVSTADQTAALQEDDLRAAGCFRVWTDTASGASTDRPKLTELFDQLRFGDTLVVWRLDRLGRSLPHLIETIRVLEAREVGFKSVQEDIDTTTPGGRLVFHVFSALASFELELVRERTMAGLASARARGRLGGRPSVMSAAIVAAGVEAVIYDAGRRYRTEPEGRAEVSARPCGGRGHGTGAHSAGHRTGRFAGELGQPAVDRTESVGVAETGCLTSMSAPPRGVGATVVVGRVRSKRAPAGVGR